MASPADLKYSKKHEWVKVEGDIATIGITDHAQHQLTDIVFVEMPEKGTQVGKDKTMGAVESVKSVSDIFAPISGEIVGVNETLKDIPETINKDAFGEGWLVKIKIRDQAELDSLISAEEYDKFVGGEN